MKKNEIKIGGVYVVKVSGRLCPVRVDKAGKSKGWWCTNLRTGRTVYVLTAAKMRKEIDSPLPTPPSA